VDDSPSVNIRARLELKRDMLEFRGCLRLLSWLTDSRSGNHRAPFRTCAAAHGHHCVNFEQHRALGQLLFGQFAIEDSKFSRGHTSPVGIPPTAATERVTTPAKHANGIVAAGIFLGKLSCEPLSVQCHIKGHRARTRLSPNAGNQKFTRLGENGKAQRKSRNNSLHEFSRSGKFRQRRCVPGPQQLQTMHSSPALLDFGN